MQFVECFFLFSLIVSVEKLFWVIFEVFLVLIYFGCAGSLLLWGFFSGCGEQVCTLDAEHVLLIAVASLLLWSTGSRPCMRASIVAVPRLENTSSVFVVHGPSPSTACGILPDQGLYSPILHVQADSLPLSDQASPQSIFCWLNEVLSSALE